MAQRVGRPGRSRRSERGGHREPLGGAPWSPGSDTGSPDANRPRSESIGNDVGLDRENVGLRTDVVGTSREDVGRRRESPEANRRSAGRVTVVAGTRSTVDSIDPAFPESNRRRPKPIGSMCATIWRSPKSNPRRPEPIESMPVSIAPRPARVGLRPTPSRRPPTLSRRPPTAIDAPPNAARHPPEHDRRCPSRTGVPRERHAVPRAQPPSPDADAVPLRQPSRGRIPDRSLYPYVARRSKQAHFGILPGRPTPQSPAPMGLFAFSCDIRVSGPRRRAFFDSSAIIG